MITVISTTLNAKDLIKSTYESVRSQKDAEFEYLVIDGESNDGSTELYDRWTRENDWFHYVSEKDRGIYDAMNKAVLYAHGDYFIFLGAGDTFVDEYTLNTISEALADKPCDILYGYVYLWNIDGSKTAYVRKIDFNYALRANPVCHQAIVAKKEMFKEKPFDVKYRYAADQDWIMWAYKNKKKIRYIDVPFVNYDTNGTTAKAFDECHQEIREVHKKNYPLLHMMNTLFDKLYWKWQYLKSK